MGIDSKERTGQLNISVSQYEIQRCGVSIKFKYLQVKAKVIFSYGDGKGKGVR